MVDAAARQPGFYWVALPDDEWTVARYEQGWWSLMGNLHVLQDDDLVEIGPRLEPPEKV